MNRIQHATCSPKLNKKPAVRAAKGLLERSTDQAPHWLFMPLHYEPNYAYPLLVWLHGPADDEGQLKRIMPLVSMRNYAAVSPRGTLRHIDAKSRVTRYGWSQTEAHCQEAEQRVFDAIEAAKSRVHIAPQRVFLAGFDCGGTMAFRLAMAYPERFAGVLSLGGMFPQGNSPLARLIDSRRVPIFMALGRDSQACPSDEVCNNLRLFHSAGLAVDLRVYPCGDEISPQMLSDMDRWMMGQVTAPTRPQQPARQHWF